MFFVCSRAKELKRKIPTGVDTGGGYRTYLPPTCS